jgi:hypothetical protein
LNKVKIDNNENKFFSFYKYRFQPLVVYEIHQYPKLDYLNVKKFPQGQFFSAPEDKGHLSG